MSKSRSQCPCLPQRALFRSASSRNRAVLPPAPAVALAMWHTNRMSEGSSVHRKPTPMETMWGRLANQSYRREKVEHSLRIQWGLGKDFFSKNGVVPGVLSSDSYAVRFGRVLPTVVNLNRLDALALRGRRRFGNAITCLVHAVLVAKALGMSKVVAPGWDIRPGPVDGVWVTNVVNDADNVLEGMFFRPGLLRPFFPGTDLSAAKSSLTPALVALYGIDIPALDPLGDKELVIHLRSGDVFRSTNSAPPNYGQPPLAFYQKVLQSRRWEKTWVVFENGLNPVIPALVSWLAQQNINFEISSSDWRTDISLCMQAKHLAGGHGTFLDPVLWGSPHIAAFYTFENARVSSDLRPTIALNNYADLSGHYKDAVLRRWQNTPLQRNLMVQYPSDLIRLG